MKEVFGFLSSIPFQIKFAIAPLFAVVTLIGLSYLATGALNTASFDMNYIVNRNLRGSNLLNAVHQIGG